MKGNENVPCIFQCLSLCLYLEGSQRISDSEISDYDCEDGVGVITGNIYIYIYVNSWVAGKEIWEAEGTGLKQRDNRVSHVYWAASPGHLKHLCFILTSPPTRHHPSNRSLAWRASAAVIYHISSVKCCSTPRESWDPVSCGCAELAPASHPRTKRTSSWPTRDTDP